MAEKSGPLAKISAAREAMRLRLAEDSLGNADDAVEAIASDIIAASSVDEVLEGGATIGARDLIGVPLKIEGFKLRPASEEYPDTESFAVINAVNMDTGEVIVVTTGAYNIVAALIRIDQLDGFPVVCAIKEAGQALRLYKPDTTTIAVAAE